MAGRLTWRAAGLGPFGWEQELPAVRSKWGDAIADLTQAYRGMARPEATRADVRRTLAAIARDACAVPWPDLDPESRARLDAQSWKLFRQQFARRLRAAQVQLCAQAALSQAGGKAGRPKSQARAVAYLVELEPLLPHSARRGPRRAEAAAELLLAAGLVQTRHDDTGSMDVVRILLWKASSARRALARLDFVNRQRAA